MPAMISGRVRTRMSLSPRRSWAWARKRGSTESLIHVAILRGELGVRMRVERLDDDRPARTEHARDLTDGRSRAFRVREHIQQQDVVERRWRRRNRVEIAVHVADVPQ